jgi:hypothetical protein
MRPRILAFSLLTLFAVSTAALAADPTGTWSWKFQRGDNEIEIKLDLKAEGDKLTGKIYSNNRETEITDGVFKNDEVSFKTVRERNGNKFEMLYKGKVEAEKIVGTVEFSRDDQSRSRPWEATRVKE